MLDPLARKLIDPTLDRLGVTLAGLGITATTLTAIGFAAGVTAAGAVATGHVGWGLAFLAVNRLCDGLDGAAARASGPSDRGGFLDIVADFIVYALIPLGFAVADPTANALATAVLLAAFMGTASSFLAFAIVAAKQGLTTAARGEKSFFHLGGLIEGSETIAFLIVICLWPGAYAPISYIFAVLCWITTFGRVAAGWHAFGPRKDS